MIAIENGIITPAAAFCYPFRDSSGNVFRFPFLGIRTVEPNFGSVSIICPKLFSLSPCIVADQLIGCTQNILCGTIILFQTNGLGVFILLFKFQNVGNGCTAEFINTLVIIAYHTDVFIPPCQKAGKHILGMVGILILVRKHIMELALIPFQYIRIGLQQPDGIHNDIIKIHGIGFFQLPGIFPINFRNGSVIVAVRIFGCKHARGLQIILGTSNDCRHTSCIKNLIIQPLVLNNCSQHTFLIIRIINGKGTVISQCFAFPTQNTNTDRMKGRCPDIPGEFFSQCVLQPLLNFLCSLVGKGNGKNLPRPCGLHTAQHLGTHAVFLCWMAQVITQKQKIFLCGILRCVFIGISFSEPQQIDNAVDEDRCFAAACTSEYQQRTLGMKDCFTLAVIQAFKFPFNNRTAHVSILYVKSCLFHDCLLVQT